MLLTGAVMGKASLRLASSLEYVLWEEEADEACVQQPLLDQ
jgi:hypothetical protein